jgi:hypothetical protein
MLTPIAYGLAILLIGLITLVGIRFLFVPRAAAAAYGVPAAQGGDLAYQTIKGVRDFTSGVLGAVLLAFAGAHATGWYMVVAAIVPFGDTAIVLRHGGTKAAAFGIHFATAVCVLVSAGLLFAV